MNNSKNNYLQKTQIFRDTQQHIIAKLSQKCNAATFDTSIESNGATIKHFVLPGGVHGYSVRATEKSSPSRIFSDSELPNITYLANHWNPSLIPDSNFSNVTGNFIITNPGSVMYISYLNGTMLFSAGYNYDCEQTRNIKRTSFFYSFQKGIQSRFNELPQGVENIIQLLIAKYNRLATPSQTLINNFNSNIHTFSTIQNDTINSLDKTI